MILFGGTFDPIHRGHVQAAICGSELLSQPVHLLLAPRPRLRQSCAASYHFRWAMLQLACQPYSSLIPFDFEKKAKGPTRTIDTLERLRRTIDENFVWLIGSDALAKTQHWYRAEELANWVSFLVLTRPNYSLVQSPRNFHPVDDVHELLDGPGKICVVAQPMIDLSATTVRLRLAHGEDIKNLVTPAVYDYIISKHVYKQKDSY